MNCNRSTCDTGDRFHAPSIRSRAFSSEVYDDVQFPTRYLDDGCTDRAILALLELRLIHCATAESIVEENRSDEVITSQRMLSIALQKFGAVLYIVYAE